MRVNPFVSGALITAAIWGLALLAASAAVPAGWTTYYNDRYGTTIDYPSTFTPEPPPDADDGRRFKSADGASFSVSAAYNAMDFNLAEYRQFIVEHIAPEAVIIYRAQGDNWFVISGTQGPNIFYERHVLSHKAEMTENFDMSYPASLRRTYDPIVARMAQSFRPGMGFQTQ